MECIFLFTHTFWINDHVFATLSFVTFDRNFSPVLFAINVFLSNWSILFVHDEFRNGSRINCDCLQTTFNNFVFNVRVIIYLIVFPFNTKFTQKKVLIEYSFDEEKRTMTNHFLILFDDSLKSMRYIYRLKVGIPIWTGYKHRAQLVIEKRYN